MRSWLISLIGIVAIFGLLALTGCPKPDSGDEAPVINQSGNAPVDASPATAEPAADPATETAAAGNEADPVGGDASTAEPGGENASLPQPVSPAGDPQLEGEWFALFGKTELGPTEHLWASGHRVSFRKNGQAFWVMVDEGTQTATMDSQWSLEGNQLKLSFLASKAVESGLSGVAPMGIGKDEEIGLASGNAPGGSSSAMYLFEPLLDYDLDHNYLVLKDSNDRLYVYGRVQPENVGAAVDGDWYGWFKSGQGIGAQATQSGDEISIMAGGSSRFTGHLSGGYFIGRFESGNDSGFGALVLRDDGQLDGAIMRKPYRDVDQNFEFVRAAQ